MLDKKTNLFLEPQQPCCSWLRTLLIQRFSGHLIQRHCLDGFSQYKSSIRRFKTTLPTYTAHALTVWCPWWYWWLTSRNNRAEMIDLMAQCCLIMDYWMILTRWSTSHVIQCCILRQASFRVELAGWLSHLKDMESLKSTMILMWTIRTSCRLRLILWNRPFILEDPEAA